jgi:hypothetical protein
VYSVGEQWAWRIAKPILIAAADNKPHTRACGCGARYLAYYAPCTKKACKICAKLFKKIFPKLLTNQSSYGIISM